LLKYLLLFGINFHSFNFPHAFLSICAI